MEKWFNILIIIILISIIYLLFVFIQNLLSEKNKIRIKLLKLIIVSLLIPIIAIWLWYNSDNYDFVNEYLLITKSESTKGIITRADEFLNSADDGNEIYYISYDYKFSLPNGSIINSEGMENDRRLPINLRNREFEPYAVEIQYLPDNPEINRVKEFLYHNTTIYEWFRYNMLSGLLILIGTCIFSYRIIIYGIKRYSAEMKEYISV